MCDSRSEEGPRALGLILELELSLRVLSFIDNRI